MIKKLLAVLTLTVCLVYILWQDSFNNLPSQDVTFITKTGEYTLHLKIADTPELHARGLMNVEYLPPRHGMIFINKEPVVNLFWMKDTYIPLDMIFVDEDGMIANIHKNAKPLDEFNKISSLVPVKYVIEINAGESDEMSLEIGDKMIE